MTDIPGSPGAGVLATVHGLVAAAHPGPTFAVSTLSGLLAISFDAPAVLVLLAVFSGQLVIGWSNDLIDAARDRSDGRVDKPLATGQVQQSTVAVALAVVAAVSVVTSFALGWAPGLLHMVLMVGSGLAYNLKLKATIWSFVPYALAFGSLPAVVWLASGTRPADVGPTVNGPPVWMLLVGAMLGVGAHLLNVLPDLADDARHGIRGLPHHLGQRRTQLLAPALLAAGTVTVVTAAPGPIPWWGFVVLSAGGGLAIVAATSSGKTPFRAAMALALLTTATLVFGSWS